MTQPLIFRLSSHKIRPALAHLNEKRLLPRRGAEQHGTDSEESQWWRIQQRWRSFDRPPRGSAARCHPIGRQSEWPPWIWSAMTIPAPQTRSHWNAHLHTLQAGSNGIIPQQQNKDKNHQIPFQGNWQTGSNVTRASCHIADDDSYFISA